MLARHFASSYVPAEFALDQAKADRCKSILPAEFAVDCVGGAKTYLDLPRRRIASVLENKFDLRVVAPGMISRDALTTDM